MGPRSHPNVEMKAELVIFRTCCLTLVKNKIEIVPIMPEKSIKKIDHKIARTPELDVWRFGSPYYQPCIERKAAIQTGKSTNIGCEKRKIFTPS